MGDDEAAMRPKINARKSFQDQESTTPIRISTETALLALMLNSSKYGGLDEAY